MHSLYNYIKEYENNKHLIKAYLTNQLIENYGDDNGDDNGNNTGSIMGFSIGIFIFILLASLAIWIWAVIVLVKYWKMLPDWGKVLGLIGVLPVLPGGPIMTLIVVYVGKQ